MAEENLSISVVIPAYNEEKYLAKALEALKNQSFTPLEVIVVNNNSTDRTVQIAEEYGVTVVDEPVQGVAPARNRGFCRARGEIIASTDADCIPPRNWLSRIAQAFQENPEIVAYVGVASYYDAPFLIRKLFFHPSNYRRNYFYYYFSLLRLLLGRQGGGTGNLAVRREAFKKTGGFDPRIRSPLACDDLEFVLRLNKVGRILFDPENIVSSSWRRVQRAPLKVLILRTANAVSLCLRGNS